MSRFLDKWHLIPGEPWQEGMEEALRESRTCAVFLGKALPYSQVVLSCRPFYSYRTREPEAHPSTEEKGLETMAKLIICVTVDWEGESLWPWNLVAMQKFRAEFPKEVPLTHFICPAYLTRGMFTENSADVIRQAIQPEDEVGLHVHPWQSLVRAAAVAPRDPVSAYLDGYGPQVPYFNRAIPPDTGHGTPLGVYTVQEIQSIIQFARDLLIEYELNNRKSVEGFRCGGWLASDPVMEALAQSVIRYDSSATDAAFFARIGSALFDSGNNIGNWMAPPVALRKPYE